MLLSDYVNFQRNTPGVIKYVCDFLFITGMRASEIFLISKNKLIYLEGSFTYTQPKTQIIRTIKIPDYFLQEVRKRRNEYGSFKTIFGNYKNLLSCCRTFVEFPYTIPQKMTFFHNFRYLYVLNLVLNGESPEKISQKLGHNELSTVVNYINTARAIYAKKHKLEV